MKRAEYEEVIACSGGCRISCRGFCYGIARENLEATPIFDRFRERYLPYLSIDLFLIETSAKMSYSSSFLSSLARGGFHLTYRQYFLVLGPAQRGVSMEPPPQSATGMVKDRG